MRSKDQVDRFEFDVDFQWEIIKYILTDKNGYKVNSIISHEYFDLDYQKVIVRGIQRYYKRKKRIVPTAPYLTEELRSLFKTKDYAKSFNEIDREKIVKKAKRLFKNPAKDPDEVFEQCKTFASYVMMKRTLEEFDVTNYTQYQSYLNKLQKAVHVGMELGEKAGKLMVASSRIRIMERHNNSDIIPTPFPGLNRLTNAGGFTKGSIITVMDRPKKGKTWFMVNVTMAYARNRAYGANKVIYFDLENGESAITCRMDQSLCNLNKKEVLSGKFDKKILKAWRQLQRFGSEIYVKRMPSGSTTADMQKVLDDLAQQYGLKFKVAIIDYVGIMGCLSGKTEDVHRISDAYLDVKNFAEHNDLDIIWTGHHVKREAYGRRESKYKPDDLAKCIDIERHVDALLGLNQSEDDIKMGLMRLEIVDIRDGVPFGRFVFKSDIPKQKLTQIPLEEIDRYNQGFGNRFDDAQAEESASDKFKKKQRSKGDIS